MRIITTVLLITLLLALSCVIKGPYPKPDCWLIITNGGLYSMDVSVEKLHTGEIEHKDVLASETKTWELYHSDVPSCELTPEDDVNIKATYEHPSLTYGGLFEKRYDVSGMKTMEITITDCPGWQK